MASHQSGFLSLLSLVDMNPLTSSHLLLTSSAVANGVCVIEMITVLLLLSSISSLLFLNLIYVLVEVDVVSEVKACYTYALRGTRLAYCQLECSRCGTRYMSLDFL